MADDYISATRRELEQWPGVSAVFGKASKHRYVTLAYRGRSRDVIFPLSPSDVRGVHNHIATVRRELLALDAARIARRKAAGPKRERNRTTRPAPPPSAPVLPNGFDKLAGFTPSELPLPLSAGFFARVWKWMQRHA